MRASSPNEGSIQIFDEQGRPVFVSREDWKTKALPGILAKAWGSPDDLYAVVVMGMEDGLFAEVEPAAKRLVELDTGSERASIVDAIVETRLGRLPEAQRILEDAMRRHGQTPLLLVNLAKVRAAAGDNADVEPLLERAIRADPNNEDALLYLEVLRRQRAGAEAGQEVFRQAARLPGSWNPQIWLAKDYLKRGDLKAALALYQPALALPETPGDSLTIISGDLCLNGHMKEAIELVLPRYRPAEHPLGAGLNLLRACENLGRRAEGRRLLQAMKSGDRADWALALRDFEGSFR